ncbi:MG2 domain-containing protein [Mucilaginibacter glaciei]|uniref:Macroglobulin domain-containing protein n=1 Tax=Mucilaginibacter glaciei TaxID=2772109 RepID=A0A926S140_9SPHI|nr:MG2 domain-containing protein [Mucilaginibacter glaciei]MBD1391764.1 hypothetical protein [Mucilaginibacter glaciei]
MYKLTFTVIALFTFVSFAFSQADSSGLKTGNGKLKALLGLPVTEKVYLHLDKPYYAPGDTIYFKAYLTMGERHQPSQISGVLHAQLIDPGNKINQSVKLRVLNGVCQGDFTLPDSLQSGRYRLRAYTQWMRNEANPTFFEQIIPVGIQKNSVSTTTGAANIDKPKVDFFPEGGMLVAGISSNIAFKAVASNGLGLPVKGIVLDNDAKQIATFAATHLGMGTFYLTPQSGKNYRAVVTYADGSSNTVALPVVTQNGITLSVNNDSVGKASISIEANKAYYDEHRDQDYTVVIYAGGKATSVRSKLDNPIISFDVLKRKLGTGVVTITLFDAVDEPLCERLIFVQNYDQLGLTLKTDSGAYAPKHQTTISLKALTRAGQPAVGNFSVSVTDESKVPVSENSERTILTDLLLISDLKGYLEQPNYYFTHLSDETSHDLDLVMLTHGYRKFQWKQILRDSVPPIKFQPENGIDINGIASSLGGSPLVNGQVSLLSPGNMILSEKTDGKGVFRFSNVVFNDTAKFILQAVTNKGKKYTKLTYNPIENQPYINPYKPGKDTTASQLMVSYLQNTQKQNAYLQQTGKLKGRMLQEVKITANKIKKVEINSQHGVADQLITGQQIGENGQLVNKLMELLRSIRFVQAPNGNLYLPLWNKPTLSIEPIKILVNNAEMEYGFDFNQFNPDMIEKVEVFENANILAFTVNYGKSIRSMTTTGILPITVKGFYKAREFYSPKYSHVDDSENPADYRSTIFWKPDVLTDKNGDATFNFYNSPAAGTYRVVVEGIDAKGNIGRQVFKYQVQ